MKRREFLAGAPFAGYSLIVLADQLPPAPTSDIGRRLDALAAPVSPAAGAAGEPHMTLVALETDLLVAGGGLAGVLAAISAARHGAKVVLVQDRSRLGGNSSSEVKMHVLGANSHNRGWREGGIIEELRLADAAGNPQRSFELWDLLLYDKVVSEPNIALLLDSSLYRAVVKDGRIQEAWVRSDHTEQIYRIRARMFCDSTGDSRLALEAGAEWREGREARAEFNEPLAVEKADRETLGSSILFTSRHHDRPMPFTPPAWARKVTREHLKFRPVSSWEYGYWWISWGGHLDTIRDDQRIRFELLSIALGVWDYIKNSGDHPSSAAWAMDWIGMIPGKRGSRRILGDHILTQHDLMSGGPLEDGAAIGGWPMDDHPPAGFDRHDLKPNLAVRVPGPYNIPLRSLYSRNIANLFMAGRNISCSHVAFTSSRVMATCAATGQAVGTAAALCLAKGITPRQLYRDKTLLEQYQQTLLRDDQTIRGVVNRDPADLARRARAAGPAAAVIDGQVRGEEHLWKAKMEGEPSIELSWPAPQKISEVQITFDTGFGRMLTLSAQASVNREMIRGPQPETVRDYTVAVRRPGGAWMEVAAVTGNFLRLRRHRFAPVEADAVRVTVRATNGDDQARIFEIRCYA
jgi:hypothetical protein